MTSAAVSQSPKRRLWPILVAVGLLGLISTLWVAREIASVSQQRLEQDFAQAARQRADEIVTAYQRPLKQFFVLQRLFMRRVRSIGRSFASSSHRSSSRMASSTTAGRRSSLLLSASPSNARRARCGASRSPCAKQAMKASWFPR